MRGLPRVDVRRTRHLLAAAVIAALFPALSSGPTPAAGAARPAGYWLVGTDGGVFSYGDSGFFGSTGDLALNQPITGMAATPSGAGYWMVASDGGIFSFGDAGFFGSTGAIRLNRPIVGMAATPSGAGYWMVASDGGIFSFGDAGFFGSTGAIRLNRPIVGMAPTPSGKGYWLVASDGGIFAFGDAGFHGSTGAIALNQPITAMAATPSGAGYWMTATDGGVFSFGDAGFFGAGPQRAPSSPAARKIVAMVPTATGQGYWQVSASGELLAFGDAPELGAPSALNRDLVGMAALPRTAAVQRPSAPAPAPDDPGPGPGPDPTPTTTTPPPAPGAAPQFFSSTANPTWGTSPSQTEERKAGRVLALAEAGDKVFLAGEFTGLVPPGGGPAVARPFLAAIDRNTGALLDWDAQPDNAVLALAVSPDGRRLYAGGRFRKIGGAPAGRIAALDVDTGLADPTFNPPLASSGVKAMALHGGTLFVGGDFTEIGSESRPQVAALDAATGALDTDWVPPENGGGRFVGQTGTPTEDGTDGLIWDMKVTGDGGMLLVAGDFLDFGGRSGLVALDPRTGDATSWQPSMDRPVMGIALWPGDRGKTFFVATGGTGGQVQAFKPGRSTRPAWVAKVDGDATDVVATTERVYLVGHYDWVLGENTVCGSTCTGGNEGDVPNRHVSAFDASDGAHDLGFTAQLNTPQGPYVALIGARHLYIGGDFTEVNGKPQPGFVQFAATR